MCGLHGPGHAGSGGTRARSPRTFQSSSRWSHDRQRQPDAGAATCPTRSGRNGHVSGEWSQSLWNSCVAAQRKYRVRPVRRGPRRARVSCNSLRLPCDTVRRGPYRHGNRSASDEGLIAIKSPLQDDLGEPAELLAGACPRDVLGELPEDVQVELPHQGRELRLSQAVVESLVPSRQPRLGVEGPEDVGDGCDPERAESLQQGAHQALRRDVEEAATVAHLAGAL